MVETVSWYVGQSVPVRGAGPKAIEICRQLGFNAWLPKVVTYRSARVNNRPIWKDGAKLREPTTEPLFPGGYWFVSFDIGDPTWGRIMRDENVARLMTERGKFGVTPKRLHPGFVEMMQSFARPSDGALPHWILNALRSTRWQDLGDGALSEDEPPHFAKGILGTILDGPFSSFPGTVDRDDGGASIWVLADIFGRQTRVEIQREAFEVRA